MNQKGEGVVLVSGVFFSVGLLICVLRSETGNYSFLVYLIEVLKVCGVLRIGLLFFGLIA